MKIVVNRCFGGFGLSDLAHDKLIEYGIKSFKTWQDARDSGEEVYMYETDNPSIYGKYFSNLNEHRTNELLIKVVEELGVKANGIYAKLRVIDIPDGIEYEIDDYDGQETIHEIHRSW